MGNTVRLCVCGSAFVRARADCEPDDCEIMRAESRPGTEIGNRGGAVAFEAHRSFAAAAVAADKWILWKEYTQIDRQIDRERARERERERGKSERVHSINTR